LPKPNLESNFIRVVESSHYQLLRPGDSLGFVLFFLASEILQFWIVILSGSK